MKRKRISHICFCIDDSYRADDDFSAFGWSVSSVMTQSEIFRKPMQWLPWKATGKKLWIS